MFLASSVSALGFTGLQPFNDPSVLAYWKFDGNYNDSSIYGQSNLTAFSSNTTNTQVGVLSNSLTQNGWGWGAWIAAPTVTKPATKTVSVNLWFKWDNSTGNANQNILALGVDTSKYIGIQLVSDGYDRIRIIIGNNSGSAGCDFSDKLNGVMDNNWHQYSGVYNGTSLNRYIDGNLFATTGCRINNIAWSTNISIGGLSAAPTNNWRGSIDEVSFWNRTLTDTDISNLYANNQQSCITGWDYIITTPFCQNSGLAGVGANPDSCYNLQSPTALLFKFDNLPNLSNDGRVLWTKNSTYPQVNFTIQNADCNGGIGFQFLGAHSTTIGTNPNYDGLLFSGFCPAACQINCSQALITFYFNASNIGAGYSRTNSEAGRTTYPDPNNNLDYLNQSLAFVRNWTFRDETTNSLFNFNSYPATLTGFCNDYSSFSYDLRNLGSGGSLWGLYIEPPKFFVTVNSQSPRIRQDIDPSVIGPYYLSSSPNTQQFAFQLDDYTGGQFQGSTAYIERPINNIMQPIHVETFDTSDKIYPNLINQTQYKVILKTSTDTRDLGPVFVTDASSIKNIVVTTPAMGGLSENCLNQNVSILSSFDLSQISCSYSSSVGLTLAEMWIYNVTSSANVPTYNTSSTSQNGVFIYPSPNVNLTYYVMCRTVPLNASECRSDKVINFRNTTGIYKGFNLNLPAKIAGVTTIFWYEVAALCITLIIAGIFGQLGYNVGAIAAVMVTMFFWYVGWLQTFDKWYISILLTFAALMYLSKDRRGVLG